MLVTCWYDYTCRYSYRALLWLERVARADADLDVHWATFSLREANREADARSVFEDPEISSHSVLALALAHAAREADFDAYHRGVFEAMHGDGGRVGPKGLLRIAERAGVDIAAFDRQRPRWLRAVAHEHADGVSRHGLFGTPTLEIGVSGGSSKPESGGVTRRGDAPAYRADPRLETGVSGGSSKPESGGVTRRGDAPAYRADPGLETRADAVVFLKLADPPEDDDAAARLWSGLCTISVCHPELVEIKRTLPE